MSTNDNNYLYIDDELKITLVELDPELIDEEWKIKQYNEILEDIKGLKSIMEEFGEYVNIQQKDIYLLEESVSHSSYQVQEAVSNIEECKESQSNYSYYTAGISVFASVIIIVLFKTFIR